MESSRVELFAAIRQDARVQESSIRALAKRYRVHRRTVRQALGCAAPPARKTPVRAAPKLDALKPAIDAMLTADLDAPRKQRHTAKRVFARLGEEHGAVDVSYWTVRDYVARRRPEIRAEAGVVQEGFVPQSPEPGAQAEVDFADVWVELAGVVTKCHLFTFRMSYSGKAVHRVYATQGQEAFFEGHVTAVDVLGGYAGVDPTIATAVRTGSGSPPRSTDVLVALPGPVRVVTRDGPGRARRSPGR